MITGATQLGNDRLLLTVDADPTTTAVDCLSGSIIVDVTTGNVYIKKTDGLDTNVTFNINIKNNFSATIAPTVNDDSTQFYSIGSLWVDTVTQIMYVNVDATAGAAVWIPITSGPQGAQGPQAEGVQGPQGFGFQGAQGPQSGGAQGPQGPQSEGTQGPQGFGFQGAQGPQAEGVQGPQGFGFQGAQGPQSEGAQGPQGPQSEGVQGPQGFGFQGAQGPQASGVQGPQGPQAIGFQGAQGPQAEGNQGPQGPQSEGVQGPQGFGFQGAQGPQAEGVQGPQGFGFQGAQGPSQVGAQGSQGFQGFGFQGAQGPSQVGAQGPQGFQGFGFQGAQGPSQVGAQGSQGFQGSGTSNTSEQIIWQEDSGTSSNLVYSNQVLTLELRDANTDGIVSSPLVPRNMDLTVNPTITIPFVITQVGAANANIRMQLTMRYIAVGELTTKAADETLLQTVAVINTLNQMHSMTFTLNAALMAAGDVMNFLLERLGSDGADTFTGRIGVDARSSSLDFTR